MHAPASFDYAILRVVPRVEREEFVNAGVHRASVLKRTTWRCAFVSTRSALRALWPELDAELVADHLEAIRRICEGDAAAGPIAQLSRRERFHWLVAPRSTIIPAVAGAHGCVRRQTDGMLSDRLEKQLLS